MQLIAVRPAGTRVSDPVASRLDELGRIDLVRFDHRPIPKPNPEPKLSRVAGAIPTWTDATRDRFWDSGWDDFWAQHPAGAGRLVRLEATGFDDAVRAARELALTTRTQFAPGERQAQAVLQLADGSWYAASLGAVVADVQGVYVARLAGVPGYWKPTVTALVPELQAFVSGGSKVVDVRGRTGTPIQT